MRVQLLATRSIRLALPFASLVAAAAVAGAGAGCEKAEDIRAYRAPKEPPQATVVAKKGDVGAEDKPIAWTLPEGWKEVAANVQFRYATIAVTPDDPGRVLTISRDRPSPVDANVKRWAGQLGLSSFSDADLPKVVTDFPLAEGTAKVVDLLGPESTDPASPRQRMLAAILPHDDEMWFFKLTGPVALVEAQKPKFDAFLKSVDFHAGAGHPVAKGPNAPTPSPAAGNLPDGHPPIGPAAPAVATPAAPQGPTAPPTPSEGPAGDIAKWSTPAGWARNAGSSMRVLSFMAQGPQGNADVAVTPLGGGFEPVSNVNRWRGQVGLPPVPTVNVDSAEKVTVAGTQAPFFDLVGPEQRMLVAALPRAGSVWYFKMTGTAAAVEAQKDAFKAFVSSVRFVEE